MEESELTAIRERWQNLANDHALIDPRRRAVIGAAQDDVNELLAEVERLRTFVQDVADDHEHQWDAVDPQEVWYCTVCREVSQDYATDVQAKARALLAGES